MASGYGVTGGNILPYRSVMLNEVNNNNQELQDATPIGKNTWHAML